MKIFIVWDHQGHEEPQIYLNSDDALSALSEDPDYRRVLVHKVELPETYPDDKPR